MRKMLLSLMLFLLGAQGILAQVTEEWVARFNGPGNGDDYATALTVDGLGNVYVTGWSLDFGTGLDYATIKYNNSGDTLWVRRYNGPGNSSDEATALAVDGLGNVYVTGRSESDYATIKYNSIGDTLWVSRYNGPGNGQDFASALAVDDSGNVYVTGGSIGGANEDYATIKYNIIGDTLWMRRYNGPGNGNDRANSLVVDDSGNVYVTGYSWGGGTDKDYATIKYNSNGDTLWVRRYNGPGNGEDVAAALALDDFGNVYVTGRSSNGTWNGYATIKYSSTGDTLWVRRYDEPAPGSDWAFALSVDGFGNVFVTGLSDGGGGFRNDYATIKYSSNGDSLWVRRYNGQVDSQDEALALALDQLGNVYVTGWSSISDIAAANYATVKYDSSGNQLWVAEYNGPGNFTDVALAIYVNGSGNVYVTGYSYSNTSGYDYATIKYSQGVGIEESEMRGSRSNMLELLQNHPNPFHHSTLIRYALPVVRAQESGISGEGELPIRLTVYDLTGRLVETLVDESQEPGVYQVEWEGKNQVSGIYFYRFQADDFTVTRKMILLR